MLAEPVKGRFGASSPAYFTSLSQRDLMGQGVWTVLAWLAFAICAVPAQAQLVTFDLQWSGASLGNAATAIGTITLDEGIVPNPGSFGIFVGTSFGGLVDFSITVSGATSGNGTFTYADFDEWTWGTGGGTLDFSNDLVGQPTATDFWANTAAPLGTAGDFNVRSSLNPFAPRGTGFLL